MIGPDAQVLAGLILVALALAVILTICWIILPFAIIGTKPLLRQLLAEQRRTNALLERLAPRDAARPPERPNPPRQPPEHRFAEPDRPARFTGSPNLPPT